MKLFFIPQSRYSSKIFRSYAVIIFVMGILITLFQYNRERKFKISLSEQKLKIYNAQIYLYVSDNNLYTGSKLNIIEQLKKISNLNEYLPNPKLRTTIIDKSGEVYYDSYTSSLNDFNNHSNRPEILIAGKYGIGSGIRMSNSFNFKFYYLVKKYDDFYIRTALPYNNEFISFLKADYIFIYFILGLFIPVFLILIRITDYFSKSISNLKVFAINAANNKEIDVDLDFGKDELGEISHQIISIYHNLRLVKNDIDNQKNKLIKHLFISREGIAFFDRNLNLELSNSHFYTFTSLLIQTPIKNFADIKTIEELNELSEFIESELVNDNIAISENEIITKTIQLNHSNRILIFKVVMFRDRSFEISVNDITKLETEKKLKQEMTANIAHELKTPVTAVSGFIETVLDNPNLSREKTNNFLEKSFNQITRLTLLLQDLSVLSKIEEASSMYDKNKLYLKKIVKNILLDYELKFQENNIEIEVDIPFNYYLFGNKFLVDAIFRNLLDNSLKYAGDFNKISIICQMKDNNFFYFYYQDNGSGIPEKHLSRIFERFYRIDKGRSRKLGGTGLGLSIVKNAILFHGGEIVAKNAIDGGLEYHFSLKRDRDQ